MALKQGAVFVLRFEFHIVLPGFFKRVNRIFGITLCAVAEIPEEIRQVRR
jgi:hypothetical protein